MTASILLVEDNEVNRIVVLEMLRALDVDATVVTDGAQAVAAVTGSRFDLVLMDCQMPVMDGYEATRRIRALEGDARHTAIVALTAHSMPGDREIALAAGMDDYVVKPITMPLLSATLDRYLSESRNRSG
jgi:CheY-like chemotaxis protein